jgi:hypothetical protein
LARGLCLLLAAFLPLAATAQGTPKVKDSATFPEELTGIQTAYLRSLEPVIKEHRQKLVELRVAYKKELQDLGKQFVMEKNQTGALAVKVELNKLEALTGTNLPVPNAEPPKDLVYLRERFEDHKFKIEEDEKAVVRDLAGKYTKQLEVWSKLYRDRGRTGAAKAVEGEIRRIEASLRGAPVVAAVGTPPPVKMEDFEDTPPAPADEANSVAPGAPGEGDPLDTAIAAAGAEAGAPEKPTAPTPPPPSDGLTLNNGWQGSGGKDRALANEIINLLGPYANSRISLGTYPGLILYDKVLYLMPLAEARKVLKIEKLVPQVATMETAGWPGAGSLKTHTFTGRFDKIYTRLILVTDAADHVVSLMLANDGGLNIPYRPLLPEYKYYDLVLGKPKKIGADGIWHKIFTRNLIGEYSEESDNPSNVNTPCVRLDTLYFDVNLKVSYQGRWYIARPFLETLLYSCNSDGPSGSGGGGGLFLRK